MTGIFVREKEKWTNKGTDRQYVADSFLSLPSFVPNFKILSQVVPEKSLTGKKVYKHTHTEKAETIYPLYTSYTRGINIIKFILFDISNDTEKAIINFFNVCNHML